MIWHKIVLEKYFDNLLGIMCSSSDLVRYIKSIYKNIEKNNDMTEEEKMLFSAKYEILNEALEEHIELYETSDAGNRDSYVIDPKDYNEAHFNQIDEIDTIIQKKILKNDCKVTPKYSQKRDLIYKIVSDWKKENSNRCFFIGFDVDNYVFAHIINEKERAVKVKSNISIDHDSLCLAIAFVLINDMEVSQIELITDSETLL